MTLHKKAFRNPRFPQDVPTHVMTFFRHVGRFTGRLAQAPGWTGTGLSCPWALGKPFPDVLRVWDYGIMMHDVDVMGFLGLRNDDA